MYDNILCHYGVQGMKWGIRRYQNPDGTLTAEGKRHIQRSEGKLGDYKKRVDKLQNKANKLYARSDKNAYGFLGNKDKAARLRAKADKKEYRANKTLRKANQFYNALMKETAKLSVSYISNETHQLAQDFIKMEVSNSQIKYNRR